ncbi:MAG: polysaccharide deacetylase family protein [Paenibacillus sp.]|uniref:polysaccharide deacetylase family protein n=1 Tax=Paenibacillus sp. TaxID=58172 RepID=UPI0029031F1C|nr:polysaccharide deacetylase family protein [Paenibacillus sp.]MDU2238981.1 polysaccharide deacetylase family protein [Paenibacillus sp.]
MAQKKRNTVLNVRRKNRRKRIRVFLQAAILLILGTLLYHAVFDVKTYEAPDKSAWNQKRGFIALSYFGVGRNGTAKLVAKSQLDEQLKALHDQGYRTISQQDILDFYAKGAPLPDKALFLAFEDGRNDSGLFAEPLLEKYNFKATFLSYADKMGNSERKFVQPKDMLDMAKTGFWELGTNGYRLSYINIFDKDGRFIGMKDEKELTDKAKVAYYNHYLMDFIRDENMIPVENRAQMEARIDSDYKAMKDAYTNSLGYVPSIYMIMHANALGEA